MRVKTSEGVHYLGTLCKRGHDYENTGQTLRLKSSNDCTACNRRNSRMRQRKVNWRKATHPPKDCEICGKIPEENEPELSFDHDHGTSVFRGWLCGSCNRGIGLLGDNIEGLKKALAYLERAEL